ncbi:amidase signature domain-containing protein [Earliella scabrosa]|nr:amidase signature domain-containing protein [Earliella scabrosa]
MMDFSGRAYARTLTLPPFIARPNHSPPDGYIKASPASQRAVRETVQALRQAGHECVPFEVPQVMDAIECYIHLTSSDGFKTLTRDLGADPVEPGISAILLGPSLPDWLRNVLAWAARRLFGDDTLARVMLASRPCSMPEFTQWVRRRDAYRRVFHEQVWDKFGFDGVIAPVLALPALPHNSCRWIAPLAGSAFLYNVLNVPVGVVPVTHVRPSDVATIEWTDKAKAGTMIRRRWLASRLACRWSGGNGRRRRWWR